MIRQDKITFLISTFELPELYSSLSSNESVHNNQFHVSNYTDRIFKRIGIISRSEKKSSKLLTQYLPVNKHAFLKKSLFYFSKDYCLENNPLCQNCYLDLCCDYYNKKNDWIE